MDDKTKERLTASVTILAGYFFLIVLWVISIEFSHTYGHWLEDMSTRDLPVLTLYALPFIGLEGVPTFAKWVSTLTGFVLLVWPAFLLWLYFRNTSAIRFTLFSLGLMVWLFMALSAIFLVAFGLWLPFSLL